MASVVVADHAHRGAVERGQRRVAQEVTRPAVEHQPAEGGPAPDGRSIHGGDIVLEAPAAGSSVGIIVAAGAEPAYRSLGMGRAARARYPEAWDVSRPRIARETPSTPCSTRPSPCTWRPSWSHLDCAQSIWPCPCPVGRAVLPSRTSRTPREKAWPAYGPSPNPFSRWSIWRWPVGVSASSPNRDCTTRES